MRGSRNFRHRRGGGGGGGGSTSIWQKKLWQRFFFFFCSFFLVLRLFNRSQMVNFKEKYHFSRFRRGYKFFWGGGVPTFSRGRGPLLIPYRNPYNLSFSMGCPDPCPRSGSALGCNLFSFPVRKMICDHVLHLCLFSCNFVVCIQSSPAIKSFLELTAWLLPGLSNTFWISSLLSSITQ